MGRQFFYAPSLGIEDEPLLVSLIKYRQRQNRWTMPTAKANLVSSLAFDGNGHYPVLDIDVSHSYPLMRDKPRIALAFPHNRRRQAVRLAKVWDKILRPDATKPSVGPWGIDYVDLNLDFPHKVIGSSTPTHIHLFLNQRVTHLQWLRLMHALYRAGVIEMGFFVWSVRRGANFVRKPGVVKSAPEEAVKATYGWLFRLRE